VGLVVGSLVGLAVGSLVGLPVSIHRHVSALQLSSSPLLQSKFGSRYACEQISDCEHKEHQLKPAGTETVVNKKYRPAFGQVSTVNRIEIESTSLYSAAKETLCWFMLRLSACVGFGTAGCTVLVTTIQLFPSV